MTRDRDEALHWFRLAAKQGDEEAGRMLGKLATEPRSAGQDMKELMTYMKEAEFCRYLGNMAGFDVTVKKGTVRFESISWDWGIEFTTILPNLNPGPGNRRGIDIF